ncbi:MAG: hypothetical protein QOJ73_318 [Streptosporangiaceae bacterium]|jgi:hypothetical protein|nr:hypothetical protein [Streptosporangiaceae bacterium]
MAMPTVRGRGRRICPAPCPVPPVLPFLVLLPLLPVLLLPVLPLPVLPLPVLAVRLAQPLGLARRGRGLGRVGRRM